MTMFATEFPTNSILSRSNFVAQIIAWLRGSNGSTVLNTQKDTILDGDLVHITGESGEVLQLREMSIDENTNSLGVRHDFPDKFGRLWRTECVLLSVCNPDGETEGIFRLKTQCIARNSEAYLETPRKPYLIKLLLSDNCGSEDGLLKVTDKPYFLLDDDYSSNLASEIILGNASKFLPIVFISATEQDEWACKRSEIEKLAYDLGGVAHVVVEPGRRFSYKIKEITGGENPYGGAIGIILPDRGIIQRLHIGWRLQSSKELLHSVKIAADHIRANLPCISWDWAELQENALRNLRIRDRKRMSAEEMEAIYLEEIEILKEQNINLRNEIKSFSKDSFQASSGNILEENYISMLSKLVGNELYSG